MINSSPQSASPSPDDSGDISPVADQLDGTHTEPAQPSSPDSDSAHSDPAHVEPAQPSSVTTAPPTSHRELVTALRKLGLPSVLSARDRAQDLLRRVAVPLWLVAGFMVTVAMLNRAMAILADSPITDGESDLDLPETVYAPLGGAVIFLVATPILGIIAAVLTSRKRSHAFASAVGVAGALVTILLPVFPSPDKLSALFWGVAITAVIFGATYIGIGSVFSWSIHRVGQEIFQSRPHDRAHLAPVHPGQPFPVLQRRDLAGYVAAFVAAHSSGRGRPGGAHSVARVRHHPRRSPGAPQPPRG
ncbi:hypothetical protein LA329_00780 [Corynebacterium falsenii]|uniref:hypothetical protein n=1 Tax=Corynebacterium falsenii TaxID=108486 RepID=UPI001CCF1430|nr:hypothetical protein [Corynebacterium falsenii]UBI06898.1 hypothetical protein LA329_00780 [Corynebacterium falsenii]